MKLLRCLIERFIVDRFYLLWRSFTFRSPARRKSSRISSAIIRVHYLSAI